MELAVLLVAQPKNSYPSLVGFYELIVTLVSQFLFTEEGAPIPPLELYDIVEYTVNFAGVEKTLSLP